jgi:hypothetical protein
MKCDLVCLTNDTEPHDRTDNVLQFIVMALNSQCCIAWSISVFPQREGRRKFSGATRNSVVNCMFAVHGYLSSLQFLIHTHTHTHTDTSAIVLFNTCYVLFSYTSTPIGRGFICRYVFIAMYSFVRRNFVVCRHMS